MTSAANKQVSYLVNSLATELSTKYPDKKDEIDAFCKEFLAKHHIVSEKRVYEGMTEKDPRVLLILSENPHLCYGDLIRD